MSTKIDISNAMHDGLGFTARRFSEVLRIAWFPYLLLFLLMLGISFGLAPSLNFQDPRSLPVLRAIFFPVVLIVNAVAMVALIRMAVLGTAPHGRSLHFSVGPREVLFVLAGLFSIMVVGLLAFGPSTYLLQLIDSFALEREGQTAFFFTEGSLHEGSENLLYANGHPIRQWLPVVQIGALVVLGYLTLRMFMLPVFVAAGSATPFRSALRASAGLNAIRLLLLFLVMVLIYVAAYFSARIVGDFAMASGALFSGVVYVADSWGLDFATPVWAERLQVGFAFVIGGVFAVVTQSFTAGLIAGFTGAIARQVDG